MNGLLRLALCLPLLLGVSSRAGSAPLVVVGSRSGETVRYAARELADHLAKATGVTPAVRVSRSPRVGPCSLFLVTDIHGAWPDVSVRGLGREGYAMAADGRMLRIEGVDPRGLLYGVYDYLETRCGCRWFAEDCVVVPRRAAPDFGPFRRSYEPPIKWREVFSYESSEPVLAGRLRLNGNCSTRILRGPKRRAMAEVSGGWGLWCHSLFSLVPPALFKSHPDYFAEVDGRRVPPRADGTQLCMTNPDLPDIIIAALRRRMAEPQKGLPVWADPVPYYWSVSQMDGHGRCTCARCRALDAAAGSPIGSILPLVNTVAAAFPRNKIGTLAYDYSRRPPREGSVRPATNVAIQLCSIEPPRIAINEPVSSSPRHASFRNDLVAWGRLCDDIILWEYVVQFQAYVSPFPDFHVFQPNMRFYRDNHVTGVFSQGDRDKGGEFSELRAYLLAKVMWNPDCDFSAAMDDFLTNYYGAAGAAVRAYIDAQTAALAASGKPLSMDANPDAHRKGYLSEADIRRYEGLFDAAEQAVANDAVRLARVRRARLPVVFAHLWLRYGPPTERRRLLDSFMKLCEDNEIWMLSEVDNRPDQAGTREQFRKRVEATLR